jgi:hypothetical protein
VRAALNKTYAAYRGGQLAWRRKAGPVDGRNVEIFYNPQFPTDDVKASKASLNVFHVRLHVSIAHGGTARNAFVRSERLVPTSPAEDRCAVNSRYKTSAPRPMEGQFEVWNEATDFGHVPRGPGQRTGWASGGGPGPIDEACSTDARQSSLPDQKPWSMAHDEAKHLVGASGTIGHGRTERENCCQGMAQKSWISQGFPTISLLQQQRESASRAYPTRRGSRERAFVTNYNFDAQP